MKHEEFYTALTYSHEELLAFNHLIHFQRTKSRIVDSMTSKYCNTGSCGDLGTGNEGGMTFDLSRLQEMADTVKDTLEFWKPIDEELRYVGAYSGLALCLLSVCTFLYRLRTLCKLYFKHRLSAKDSFQLTFAINNELRGKLVPEAREGRVIADVEEPNIVPATTSTSTSARYSSIDAARLMGGLREISELRSVTPRGLQFEP